MKDGDSDTSGHADPIWADAVSLFLWLIGTVVGLTLLTAGLALLASTVTAMLCSGSDDVLGSWIVDSAMVLGGALFFFGFGSMFYRGTWRFRQRISNPTKPWLWRRDWQSHRIVATPIDPKWMAGALFATFLLVVTPACAYFADQLGRGVWLFWLVFGMIANALTRMIVRSGPFGKGVLYLETLPGQPGASIEGRIELPAAVGQSFRVALQRVRIIVRRPGAIPERHSQTGERRQWQSEAAISVVDAADSKAVVAPFSFAIPSDAVPTDARNQSLIRWYVKISDPNNGERFARFEVPVFCIEKGGAS